MADQVFSSQAWPIGTSVTMTSVPWDAAYKDIVQFDDLEARDSWLDSQPAAALSTTRMTYIGPGATITLPCPVTTAERFNYLYVDNPSYYISDNIDTFMASPRRYCYFITGVDYLSPAACMVSLQLDVWTTWAPFCRFHRAFVARGHAAIANRNLWDGTSLTQITSQKMRRYLAVPEEVDAGGEYVPIDTRWTDLTVSTTGAAGTFIGVMSSVDLAEAWGDTTNPNIKSASGSVQEGMLAGVQVVYFKTNDFLALLTDLRDAPWVSRNIMQVWLAVGRITAMADRGTIHGHTYYTPTTGSPSDYYVTSIDVGAALASHYSSHRLIAPKLMTAPYSYVELNTFEGSPLVLKPQRLSNLADTIMVANGISMAPWDRIAIYPLYYGAGDVPGDVTYNRQTIEGTITSARIHKGDLYDVAVWLTGLPRFSFTSDGYLSWLASGSHSRAWSYQNNDWNYHKATLSRELGYVQSSENIDLRWKQQEEQQDLWEQQYRTRNIMNLMDSLSLDIVGTIGDVAKTATNGMMEQASNALSNRQFKEASNLEQTHSNQNFLLQGYAQRGDYQQTIAALMATQRDAEITPPSVVGSAGGNGWNYAMGLLGFRTTIKVPAAGQEAILFDYFTRFGYAINELIDMPGDLRLMTRFTYWKLQESFLSGQLTETAKQTIRGIFERGVTVWSDPAYIMITSWQGDAGNGINTSNVFSY